MTKGKELKKTNDEQASAHIDSEFGPIELRPGYMIVTPLPGQSIGLEEGRFLAKIKRERYGDAPVYLVYHNPNGASADYAFISRADRFCGENAIPLIIVVDPSPRARANIAVAHLLSKAHCFKTIETLEAAFEYVESHRL